MTTSSKAFVGVGQVDAHAVSSRPPQPRRPSTVPLRPRRAAPPTSAAFRSIEHLGSSRRRPSSATPCSPGRTRRPRRAASSACCRAGSSRRRSSAATSSVARRRTWRRSLRRARRAPASRPAPGAPSSSPVRASSRPTSARLGGGLASTSASSDVTEAPHRASLFPLYLLSLLPSVGPRLTFPTPSSSCRRSSRPPRPPRPHTPRVHPCDVLGAPRRRLRRPPVALLDDLHLHLAGAHAKPDCASSSPAACLVQGSDSASSRWALGLRRRTALTAVPVRRLDRRRLGRRYFGRERPGRGQGRRRRPRPSRARRPRL